MPRIRNVQRNSTKIVSPIRRDYRARQMNMNNNDVNEDTINNKVSQEESDTFNSADNLYGDNTYNQDSGNEQESGGAQETNSSSNGKIKGPINVDITKGVRRLFKNPGVLITMLAGVFLIAIVILIASLFQGVYQSFGIIEFFENLVSGDDDYRKEYEEYWGEICGGECDTETDEMLEAQEDFYNKLKDQGLNAHQEHMVVTVAYYGYDIDQFKGDYSEDATTLSEADEDSEVDFEKEAGMVKKLSGAAKKGDSEFYSWLKKKDYLTKKPVYDYFLEKHNNNSDAAKDDMIDEIKQIIGEYEDKPKVSALNSNVCVDTSTYIWPIGSVEITESNGVQFAVGDPQYTGINNRFGYGEENNWRVGKYHGGVDLQGDLNSTNVIAMSDGEVIATNDGCPTGYYQCPCGGKYGNYVFILDSNGYQQEYGHMYEGTIAVKVGDKVKAGQVLGKVGSSGSSTGAHLHITFKINGVPVDPLQYLDPNTPRGNGNITCNGAYVAGDSNAETICLSFKAAGYDDTAVSAMLVNFEAESGFNPSIKNGDQCMGIAQWCPNYGRPDTFMNGNGEWQGVGDDWDNLENQIKFVMYELTTSYYSPAKKALDNPDLDAQTKSGNFCCVYEVPLTCSGANQDIPVGECQTRANNGATYLNFVKNGCK